MIEHHVMTVLAKNINAGGQMKAVTAGVMSAREQRA